MEDDLQFDGGLRGRVLRPTGRSQSGVVIALAGEPVGWAPIHQLFVALSTAKAEVISYTEATILSQALRLLIEELYEGSVQWALLNDSIACGAILS